MTEFAPILHSFWHKGNKPNEVIHTWAEDGTQVPFIVPEQLRDIVVKLQNHLSHKYQMMKKAEEQVVSLRRFFESL